MAAGGEVIVRGMGAGRVTTMSVGFCLVVPVMDGGVERGAGRGALVEVVGRVNGAAGGRVAVRPVVGG